VSGEYTPPPPGTLPPLQRPPVFRRIFGGSLILVGLLFLLVVLPAVAFAQLRGYGVSSSLPLAAVEAGGVVIAGLTALRYVVKPTRAYGPVGMVRAVAAVLYLVAFTPFGSLSTTLQGALITVTYGDLLLVALAIPLLSFASSALTTAEDIRHPFERLRYDFPTPGAPWR
jgi:hypothetical protein